MATPMALTSSPTEKWDPEGLPASEEPVGPGSKSIIPPKEEGSFPVISSSRASQIKPYEHTESSRMTLQGDTGPAKHSKGHARGRNFKCVICKKRFRKKSSLLIHQWSHTTAKGLAGLGYGAAFGRRAPLPICTPAHLLKVPRNVESPTRKPREELSTYSCQKCRKIFCLHENLIKHQKIHLLPVPGPPQAGNPWIDQKGTTEEAERHPSELFFDELTKMRENFDLLILNQQVQLQVLQGIQSQLYVLLPGNDLINANIYSLGLLLSQQSAAMRSTSLPETAPPFFS